MVTGEYRGASVHTSCKHVVKLLLPTRLGWWWCNCNTCNYKWCHSPIFAKSYGQERFASCLPLLQHFRGSRNSFRRGWCHPRGGAWREPWEVRHRRWTGWQTISAGQSMPEPWQLMQEQRWRRKRMPTPPTTSWPPSATIGGWDGASSS